MQRQHRNRSAEFQLRCLGRNPGEELQPVGIDHIRREVLLSRMIAVKAEFSPTDKNSRPDEGLRPAKRQAPPP